MLNINYVKHNNKKLQGRLLTKRTFLVGVPLKSIFKARMPGNMLGSH